MIFIKNLYLGQVQLVIKKIKQEYVEHCLDLLRLQRNSGLKNFKFDEDQELMKIRQKFGKYIPELQQESRESQIEKILN